MIREINTKNWEQQYKDKLVSPEFVAAQIKSGDRVYIGQTSSVAYGLANPLMAREAELENVTILSSNMVKPIEAYLPGHEKAFRINTFYMGASERGLNNSPYLEYFPTDILQQENWVQYAARPNWAFFEVSLPDEEGYMSFGPGGVTHHVTVQKHTENIVVQVNRNAPYVFGEQNKIHVSQVDYITEADTPLNTIAEPAFDETATKIADFILDQIPDGACIQLGIGGMAGAVGNGLKSKNDLGIHSEMLTDSFMHLMKAGNVTNMRKSFMPGKSGVVFAFGTQNLYDFCHKNEDLYFAPYSVINDVNTIATNDNFISINTCLSVDLLGQVSAESIGFRQYSGTGGQVDFVRGSQLSKNGKSFIALNSSYTDKNGKLQSKICLSFPPGTAVTTPRTEVQHIVTEYGCVNLKQLTREDRCKALISIAHPAFREQLTDQAKEVGLIW